MKNFLDIYEKHITGFFLGCFASAVFLGLSSFASSSGRLQDGYWWCEVKTGRTQCADLKAFSTWWDDCRKKDYERWPMANHPEVAFGEALQQKYGERIVK